jgi:1,4-alpha-glucan branching enzyme
MPATTTKPDAVRTVHRAIPTPAGQGAHEVKPGHVSFALWAPWKKSVHLIGEFNRWNTAADPMTVDHDGVWRLTRPLPPGAHAYQYFIDGQTAIADPYAREVRDVPGRPQPHSVVRVGEEPFVWRDADFKIKPFNQLVIYELHVGDFSPAGTFDGVVDKLDHIQNLGVSAVELMPIQEFPGDRSWGYNPAFFFAPEQRNGDARAFKRLVDECHNRGIAVILDMVFNHTAPESPLNLLYRYDQNPLMSTDGNPWGFPDLNHWNDATKRLIKDCQDYWLNECHVDGFRYDHVEGIRWDGVNGISFISWAARQTRPGAILIAEMLVQDPAAVVEHTEINASWHWQFSRALRCQLVNADRDGFRCGDMDRMMSLMTHAGSGYSDNSQPINYVESHDEERLAWDVRRDPASNDGSVIRKAQLGALAMFTAQGIPMIYAGQEFAAGAVKTVDESKLPWGQMEQDAGRVLYRHIASLAHLRQTCPAFQFNNIAPILVDHQKQVIVFKRWTDDGSVAVIALNFSPERQFVTFSFPEPGKWHEWLFDYDETAGHEPFNAEIPDSLGKVWVLQRSPSNA